MTPWVWSGLVWAGLGWSGLGWSGLGFWIWRFRNWPGDLVNWIRGPWPRITDEIELLGDGSLTDLYQVSVSN